MSEQPLVSIIIPVYNVEQYLRECLDSVISQTYRNLEIIIVNDGSPDGSGSICEEYAAKDSRIKYFVKENGGLSDARNYGLKHIGGEYFIFLDSDDAVSPRQIGLLVANALKYNATVSCGSMLRFHDGKSYHDDEGKNQCKVFSGNRFAELMMRPMGVFCFACGRLMHKSIAPKLSFPKGVLFEDVFTMPKAFYDEERIVLTDEELYFYRFRRTSLSHSSFTPRSMHEMDAYLDVMHFGEERNNRKIVFYSAVFFVTKYHYYWFRVIKHHMNLSAYRKKYKNDAHNCWSKIFRLGR